MLAIQNFQQRLYTRYKNSLPLPARYQYIYGNPVQPVVPVQAVQKGVCLIAASPPARLATIGPEQGVPVADDCTPFNPVAYFDGSRVRLAAGLELDKAYLAPLGLRREQCWLTYMVRVFLFKDEHLAKYRRLGCPWPERETFSQFEALARAGLPWLEEELALARPRLVITLGAEVAGVLQDVRGAAAGQALLDGELKDVWLGEAVYPALHLGAPEPEPGHLLAARRVVRRLV